MVDINIRSQISATTLELSTVKQNLITTENKLKKLNVQNVQNVQDVQDVEKLTTKIKELETKIGRQLQAYNTLMQSYTKQKAELTALKQKQNA